MKNNDFEVLDDTTRRGRTPSRRNEGHSRRPAWFFRVAFLVITVLALLLSAVVIYQAKQGRDEGGAEESDIPKHDPPQTTPSPEDRDAADVRHDEPADDQTEPLTDERASDPIRTPETGPEIDGAQIAEIISDQKRARTEDDSVYRQIANAHWNIARLLKLVASNYDDSLMENTDLIPRPADEASGPYYYFRITVRNLRRVLSYSQIIAEASPMAPEKKNLLLNDLATAQEIEDYSNALRMGPVILLQVGMMIKPAINDRTKAQAELALHRMHNRTGHALKQSEQNYSDLADLWRQVILNNADRETVAQVQAIHLAHRDALDDIDNPLKLIANHMDATVNYLALLIDE